MLKLQIVYDDDARTPLCFPAGGPVETDLVTLIETEVMKRGVGYFRSEADVREKLRAGIRDAVYAFKALTLQVPL